MNISEKVHNCKMKLIFAFFIIFGKTSVYLFTTSKFLISFSILNCFQ